MIKLLNKLSINTITGGGGEVVKGGYVSLCYYDGMGLMELIDSESHYADDEETERRCCMTGGTEWYRGDISPGSCIHSPFRPKTIQAYNDALALTIEMYQKMAEKKD